MRNSEFIGIKSIAILVVLVIQCFGCEKKELTCDDFVAILEDGNYVAFESALKAGFDPNCKTSRSCNPLYFAAVGNKPEFVEVLLEHGADPDAACDGMTPLRMAVGNDEIYEFHIEKKVRIVRALIESGANVNLMSGLTPSIQSTPLHRAVQLGDTQTARILLEAGADLNLPDYKGESSLDSAVALGKKEMIDLLKEFIE